MSFLSPWLANYELHIKSLQIHRINNSHNLLSNLKPFNVEVQLRGVDGALVPQENIQPAPYRQLSFGVDLIYEDGGAVPPPVAGGEPHVQQPRSREAYGPFACAYDGEPHHSRLQFSRRTTTRVHRLQKFKLRIAPTDEEVRRRFPKLTATSAPFKIVTKLPTPGIHGPPPPGLLYYAALPPAPLPVPLPPLLTGFEQLPEPDIDWAALEQMVAAQEQEVHELQAQNEVILAQLEEFMQAPQGQAATA